MRNERLSPTENALNTVMSVLGGAIGWCIAMIWFGWSLTKVLGACFHGTLDIGVPAGQPAVTEEVRMPVPAAFSTHGLKANAPGLLLGPVNAPTGVMGLTPVQMVLLGVPMNPPLKRVSITDTFQPPATA